MGRRKKHRRLKSTPIIYITAIISLSLMGVGYGMWTDGLNINVNMTTGNVNPVSNISSNRHGDLNIDVSEDGRNIYISGEVYPSFKDDLTINILDNGTVPFILKKIEGKPNNIAELNKKEISPYGLFSTMIRGNVVESFNLNISPPVAYSKDLMMQQSVLSMKSISEEEKDIKSQIDELKRQIQEQEAELNRLNKTEHHKFRYILHFVQGI